MGFSIIQLIASASTTPAPLLAEFLFTRMGLMRSMRLSYVVVVIGFVVASILRYRLKETVENPARVNVGEMLGEYPTSLKASIDVWKVVPRFAFVLFIVFVFTRATMFASGPKTS